MCWLAFRVGPSAKKDAAASIKPEISAYDGILGGRPTGKNRVAAFKNTCADINKHMSATSAPAAYNATW